MTDERMTFTATPGFMTLTVGLLGAEVEINTHHAGASYPLMADARMNEAERRILALEAELERLKQEKS